MKTVAERLGVSEAERERLSHLEVLDRLLETGMSRLTAERVLEIDSEPGEPGRARRRAFQRR